MGIKSTLVAIVIAASTFGQPAQPQQYRDFFELFHRYMDSHMKTMLDGSRVFYHGWINAFEANLLSYREGIKGEGETRYLITCHGVPKNPADEEGEFTCYIDGSKFGAFDGQVDARYQGRHKMLASVDVEIAPEKNNPDKFKKISPSEENSVNLQHQRTLKYLVDNPPSGLR